MCPIFLHRPTFDARPIALQDEMRAAVRDAVALQRRLHIQEEEDAMIAIRNADGEIVELTPEQQQSFVTAVTPSYGEARGRYGQALLSLVNL